MNMMRRSLKLRALMIPLLSVALFCPNAFAWGGHDGHDRGRGGHDEHYYRNGRWYMHNWLGFEVVVAALTIGAIVMALPPRSTMVVVGGVPYYYYDNVYYRPYSGGYVVVPAPVVTQPIIVAPQYVQPVVQTAPGIVVPSQGPELVTINVPNSRGGYTPITLKRVGNGFVGPQGEYYSEHPTVEELRTLYGG